MLFIVFKCYFSTISWPFLMTSSPVTMPMGLQILDSAAGRLTRTCSPIERPLVHWFQTSEPRPNWFTSFQSRQIHPKVNSVHTCGALCVYLTGSWQVTVCENDRPCSFIWPGSWSATVDDDDGPCAAGVISSCGTASWVSGWSSGPFLLVGFALTLCRLVLLRLIRRVCPATSVPSFLSLGGIMPDGSR